jgi:Phospholipase_D-nuclease N-terminal
MNRTLEVALHWWASLTIVVIGMIAAMVETSVRLPGSVLLSTAEGLAGCIVAGFYFYMFVECVIGRRISRRAAWIVFFFVLPVFSALTYFMISRSALYSSARAPGRS